MKMKSLIGLIVYYGKRKSQFHLLQFPHYSSFVLDRISIVHSAGLRYGTSLIFNVENSLQLLPYDSRLYELSPSVSLSRPSIQTRKCKFITATHKMYGLKLSIQLINLA